MQKRNYLELPKENGPRFYYRSEPLQKSKDELEEFLEWNNLAFARKMMYSHELKANNLVEGYGDDLELIEAVIKRKIDTIKDAEIKQRILNLYHGYYYILHHRKMDAEHLHELYQILSENLLCEYDRENMGPLYREKAVYILQNGRLDVDLAEGVYYQNIEKLMSYYFAFVNETCDLSQIDEYIKSQIMHFYFVYIHPYFDVNGRTSRTMAMWYLLKKQAYPYIIFNRGISFKGSKYDRVIKDAKESCDITYFYFDFFGSRNNNVLCRAKKETRHWSIVVCEGYCIQCSFSILDRGSRYRNFLGIIVSQLMVILTYVEIKEIRVL